METDAALFAAWRTGDAAAGEALFERHFDALYRFFYNKAGSHLDDLVQETFAACLTSASRYRAESSFRGFVLGIARHKLLDSYRRQAVRQTDVLTAEEHGVVPIDAAERNQERRVLLRSLRKLPLESQILLELAYWEGLKDREIAEIYDAPVGTLKSRIRKARLLLRETIATTLTQTQFDSTVDTIDAWLDSMRRYDPRGAASSVSAP